tara:strand:- start:2782 stop:3528 length:747 start_codon:yes stop_codon:yes gene_type:complete
MANQLNSAQGMDLKTLKTGQVVLTKVIRTSNPDIVSLELYEGGIVNTSRSTSASTEGQYEGLGMMMAGYKGFTNSGSVTIAWQNITVSNLELMLGVEELDIDNGIWEEFRTKAGKTKEMLELNILNPVAVYNPQLNEECNIRFRAVIVENTVISKDKFKWAEDKLNIFDKEDQIEAIVKQYAKRPGANKPAIKHNGSVVYRDVKVSFCDPSIETMNHTFLKSDSIEVTTQKVDTVTGEIVQEYSEDLA